jgi:hypothetical protein
MAAEHDYDFEVARRRARPGPYPPPNDRGMRPAHADLRLAQLAGLPLRTVQRLSAGVRDELLEHHRGKQRTAERNGLHARLARLAIISHSLDPGAGEQHVWPASAPDVPAHRRAVVACVGEEVALAAGPGRGADGEARPRIVARLHRQPGQRRV